MNKEEMKKAAFEWFAGDETGDLGVAFQAGAEWAESSVQERCEELECKVSGLVAHEIEKCSECDYMNIVAERDSLQERLDVVLVALDVATVALESALHHVDNSPCDPFDTASNSVRVALKKVSDDAQLLEVGRRAVEDSLIEWRDSRLSTFGRRNGLVICEKDGSPSSIIRFGVETALGIALLAISEHLEKGVQNE